jgi:hypothetical protein
MTRFLVTQADLEALVETHKPGWLARARERTDAMPAAPAAVEFPALWSEIKDVFIKLQGSKCAFCEKWLEEENIEHDVEHFRPKSKVSRWQVPRSLAGEGVSVNQPASGGESGYRYLAYHVLNYATACKYCNTVLKKDHFPIRGNRRPDAKDPDKLRAENAYLIYPIGDGDDDPEELIGFTGLIPSPKKARGTGRLRALVTIEFFKLADWRTRKSLLLDRAEWIEKLFWALERTRPGTPPGDMAKARAAVDRLTSTKFRHANCLRSFKRLYEADRTKARKIYEDVQTYLQSYT